MKPVLLLPCALLLFAAAMFHRAIASENWPVLVVYRESVIEAEALKPVPEMLPGKDDKWEEEPEPHVAAPEFPLDLNLATREELMHVPGFGEVLSGRIVQYRDHIGGYTELSQLTDIYGISENTLERIGGYLTIDSD